MTIFDFPVGDIPSQALIELQKVGIDPQFIPSNWLDDMKKDSITAMVYWYPQYIGHLYDFAMKGIGYEVFLSKFSETYTYFFEKFFQLEVKRLRKIQEKFTQNHLDEVVIEKGRLWF